MAAQILVVEDDPSIASLLDEALTDAGHQVTLARDGRAALAAVGATHPDLILMDLMLPVMNGIEASRALKACSDPLRAQIPIVAMSAGVNLRVAAHEGLVEGLLPKPFNLDELLAIVTLHLAPHRQAEHSDVDVQCYPMERAGRGADVAAETRGERVKQARD